MSNSAGPFGEAPMTTAEVLGRLYGELTEQGFSVDQAFDLVTGASRIVMEEGITVKRA